MIGGPRLCEPLLATGLGRFTGAPRAGTLTALGKEHLPIGEAVGFQAHRNALRQTRSELLLSPVPRLPPWHSGFDQLSLDPSRYFLSNRAARPGT
jgi:hypothetical protein